MFESLMSCLQQLVNKSEVRYVPLLQPWAGNLLLGQRGLTLQQENVEMVDRCFKPNWRIDPLKLFCLMYKQQGRKVKPTETEQQKTDGCCQTESLFSYLKATERSPYMKSSPARYLSQLTSNIKIKIIYEEASKDTIEKGNFDEVSFCPMEGG